MGTEGEGLGVEEEDIDLPNLPEQQDDLDIDQDNVPVNAGEQVCLHSVHAV